MHCARPPSMPPRRARPPSSPPCHAQPPSFASTPRMAIVVDIAAPSSPLPLPPLLSRGRWQPLSATGPPDPAATSSPPLDPAAANSWPPDVAFPTAGQRRTPVVDRRRAGRSSPCCFLFFFFFFFYTGCAVK